MRQSLLANRYRIIRQLASGGFGDTFLAEDTHLPSGRTCVIKQLRPMHNNPQVYQLVKERFQREAVILEDLGNSHDQIPTLFAYFEDQGQFYLVQEYIQGQTLSSLVKSQGKQEETFVKRILLKLLVVLEYIQSKRIIHRDIKPDNIIIRHHDQMPILIDFGAIKEAIGTVMSPRGNSTSSIVIGTPGFMPPEQSIGRPVFSSDLYALGLTAIYLLTGRIPEELETEPLTGEIIWRQYALNVSPTLANAIDKAIKSQANQRFTTAQMMRQALQGQPRVTPTELSFPSSQQGNVILKNDWIKITIAAVTIGITFLAGWTFFSKKQQQKLEERISEIQSEQTNQAKQQEQELAERQRQLDEKQRQLEQNQEELAEKQRQLQQEKLKPTETIPSSSEQTSLIWRSQSNLTRIANLNKICFGSSTLSLVETVFGYGKPPFTGTITIPAPQTEGCTTGDTLRGNFKLSGNAGNCVGTVKITWKNNDNAFIQWNITNLGLACPVATSNWQVNTYPVKL